MIDAWDAILESLDQQGSVANLISIDFTKAFNRMGHQACVRALIEHDASVHMTRIVDSFLTQRMMVFKAGEAKSSPKLLRGGSPQGMLLGNFMFVIATNRLEEKLPPAAHEGPPPNSPVALPAYPTSSPERTTVLYYCTITCLA